VGLGGEEMPEVCAEVSPVARVGRLHRHLDPVRAVRPPVADPPREGVSRIEGVDLVGEEAELIDLVAVGGPEGLAGAVAVAKETLPAAIIFEGLQSALDRL